MPVDIDLVTSKKILLVCSNPAGSGQTGWPIGFWWAELTHAYWEFTQHGYEVEIVSPDGGRLAADSWSDPRDASGYSAEDLITLGFVNSPEHLGLIEDTKAATTDEAAMSVEAYDGIFLVGGQAPMYTFYHDKRLHELVVAFYEAGKMTAIVCHATCVLLKTRLSTGELLVTGKTWTGFANSEEDYADAFVGQRIQPFRIEDEARALPGTNFIVQGAFRPHAVRDGLLVTGQQQYSGAAAARLVIEALGR
ncbi:type 1 glutamine amidotransferase domain-containing protein [Flindersiella endophytica]